MKETAIDRFKKEIESRRTNDRRADPFFRPVELNVSLDCMEQRAPQDLYKLECYYAINFWTNNAELEQSKELASLSMLRVIVAPILNDLLELESFIEHGERRQIQAFLRDIIRKLTTREK